MRPALRSLSVGGVVSGRRILIVLMVFLMAAIGLRKLEIVCSAMNGFSVRSVHTVHTVHHT